MCGGSVCLSHTDPTGCCYNQANSPSRACQPHPPLVRTGTWAAVRPHPQAPWSIAQGTSCSLWAPWGWAQSQPQRRRGQQPVTYRHRPFLPNLLHHLTTLPSNRHQLRATPMAKVWGWGFRTQLVGKMSSHSAVFVGRHWVLRTELAAEG